MKSQIENYEKEKDEFLDKLIKIKKENLDKATNELKKEYGEDIYNDNINDWLKKNVKEYKEINDKIETLDKELTTLRERQFSEQNNKRYEEIQKIKGNYKFKNKNLKDNFENLDIKKDVSLKYAKAFIDLDKINTKNDYDISESPYSFSIYSKPKGEDITWEGKPDESYRLSDHWNFYSRGEIHCQLENTKELTQKIILAKYNKKTGKYKIIKEY